MNIPPDAYFSGHFDGEGCVRMMPHCGQWRLYVAVSHCHEPTLGFYVRRFGGSVRRHTPAKNKTMWRWEINNHALLATFIETVLPFSLEKRPQLVVAQEWIQRRLLIPRQPVPPEFREYGRQCAAELSRLKRELPVDARSASGLAGLQA